MLQSILSKLLQSDQFSNLMQNEALMKLVLGALEASMNLKGKLDETSAQILQKFSLVHQSEVEIIKAQVTDLESQVDSLKNQIQVLIKEKQASQQVVTQLTQELKISQDQLAQATHPPVVMEEEGCGHCEAEEVTIASKPKKNQKAKVKQPIVDHQPELTAQPEVIAPQPTLVKWNKKMNKADLLIAANALGVGNALSEQSTRDEIILALQSAK